MYGLGVLIWEFFVNKERKHVNCIIVLLNSLGSIREFFGNSLGILWEFFRNSLGILSEFFGDL